MRISLHNELTGRREDLQPAEPPECGIRRDATHDDLRLKLFPSLLEATLRYMGYEPSSVRTKSDISCGGPRPGGGIWLKPAGMHDAVPLADCRARGFDDADVRLLCLKSHYRRAVEFSWRALEDARAERAELLGVLRNLAEARVAPNTTGLAGYKKRFRDALADDLDFPEALATLWDALRPGALSPGSRLAALKDADQVFGILGIP